MFLDLANALKKKKLSVLFHWLQCIMRTYLL